MHASSRFPCMPPPLADPLDYALVEPTPLANFPQENPLLADSSSMPLFLSSRSPGIGLPRASRL